MTTTPAPERTACICVQKVAGCIFRSLNAYLMMLSNGLPDVVPSMGSCARRALLDGRSDGSDRVASSRGDRADPGVIAYFERPGLESWSISRGRDWRNTIQNLSSV